MPTTAPVAPAQDRARIRRQNFTARSIVVDHAILTGAQRVTVREALDDGDRLLTELYAEVKRLERENARLGRVTPDNPDGYRLTFPTEAELTGPTPGRPIPRATAPDLDEWRADMVRTLGKTETLAEAIGITLGAASMCWENPAGAGTFESRRASVLVDVLTEHIAERQNPDLSDYLEAAHGLICNAHRARVDDVTEADGASPGWAEAARRWIDAYPPTITAPTAGHAEFAAEVGRLRERAANDAHTEAMRVRDEALDELAERTRERDRLRARNTEIEAARIEQLRTIERLRAERDKAVHQLGRATDRAERYRADVQYAEHRLELVEAAVRAPRPGLTADLGAEDSWAGFGQERAELADQLANTNGAIRLVSNNGPLHHYDHDTTEQEASPFVFHIGDHFVPVDEPDDTDMTAAQFRDAFNRAQPGPRRGPTPAVPPPHSPSGHMLDRCWCQTGDYTEDELEGHPR